MEIKCASLSVFTQEQYFHFNFKLIGINHSTLFLKDKTWGGDLFIKKVLVVLVKVK